MEESVCELGASISIEVRILFSCKLTVNTCQLCGVVSHGEWTCGIELSCFVPKSEEPQSFKTAKSLGDSSLSVSAPRRAADKTSKQIGVNAV